MTNKHSCNGGGYFNKFKNILLTDVKKFNIYLLLIVSLIIIGSVGYTSYSLFSYEVYSDSIYVSFKDEEKPVCVIGEPAVSLMEKSSTTTFEMNCTDNYTVADKDLTTSNFTVTGDITVTSVTKEKVGKAMKYIITVTSGTTGGVASIKLNAGAVTDSVGNGNAVSNTSEVFVRVTCDAMSEDVSGANSPEVSLASNMIPVCYNSTANLWVKADSTNTNTDYPWYSYSDKKWANAVTVIETNREFYLNSETGMPIKMNDINTMFVWIPRFSATMVEGQAGTKTNNDYCSGASVNAYNAVYCIQKGGKWHYAGYNNPGAFDIIFVNKDTKAHDAFDFGESVSGFWIGKFENSSNVTCTAAFESAVGSDCNLRTIRPKIIPNATSWRGAMVSTFFYDIQKMTDNGNQYGFNKEIDTKLDTHLIKNSEWGAIAYLTQSIYGRCSSSTECSVMGINNNAYYQTGFGAPVGSDATVENGTYNSALGMDASTTGNIYGVYDMSGGTEEYVMAAHENDGKIIVGMSPNFYSTELSGFNGYVYQRNSLNNYSSGIDFPNSKYYDLYTTKDAYINEELQHALVETENWYGSVSLFFSTNNPWVVRGGAYSKSSIFSYWAYSGSLANSCAGDACLYACSRTSLIID